MARHDFHPTILRAYDIRGIVSETLGFPDAFAIGAAFGSLVQARDGNIIAVGWDGRTSSPGLTAALCDGLLSTDADIRRIGLGPTPMLYFAERHLEAHGAIMVTGSHNPPDHNGFKMVIGGNALHGDGIQELAKICANDSYRQGSGTVTDVAIFDAYIERLLHDLSMDRPLAVAWDPGNGAAGPAVMRLCERIPGRHVLLNENIDGRFPAHQPDPTDPEAMVQLQEAVRAEKCDLGIAFDGDGDRIGVVDAFGRILWGDQLLTLFAAEVLETRPKSTIIADVKASQTLFDEVERLGGRPLMWRTGHSLIKAKMAETGAPLAGEMSGHIYFADRYFGFDDALYAAIRILNIASRAPGGITRLRDRLPASSTTPEIRVPCPNDRKQQVVAEVAERLKKTGDEVTTIDGVRVRSDGGWWLLRASNTEEMLVVRCEAPNAVKLRRLCLAVAEQLCASSLPIGGLDRLLNATPDQADTDRVTA